MLRPTLTEPASVLSFPSIATSPHGSLTASPCFLAQYGNVIGAGSPTYDNAYFEINYVRAYTTGPPLPSPTSTPQGASTTVATIITSTAQTSTTRSADRNGARRIGGSAGAVALVCALLGMLVLA